MSDNFSTMKEYNWSRIITYGLAALIISLSSCKDPEPGLSATEYLESQRDSLLIHHSFSRSELKGSDMLLLTGNGEMGGLVRHDGLGFDSIWCSDLWTNKEFRIPLQGLKFQLEGFLPGKQEITDYSQELSLKDGIVNTDVVLEDGRSYSTELFFSANEKRMLVLKISNTGNNQPIKGKLRLPQSLFQYTSDWPDYELGLAGESLFRIRQVNDREITGESPGSFFTPGAWCLQSTARLEKTITENEFSVEIAAGSEQCFYFSYVSQWQDENYASLCSTLVSKITDYEQVKKQHSEQWFKDWSVTPLLIIPDLEHEQLFYRSVFWLFCTAGSEHFLPGEAQFAGTCWNMRPFTYGAAGWATLAFIELGHFEKARQMLMNHYKPAGLHKNSALYIKDTLARKEAFSFAHEARTDGSTTTTCDDQRHLNGFALALFHKYYVMTGDTAFLHDFLYPVAKGVAEFWRGLASWNDSVDGYIFPVLRSVSEDLFERSLLDVVLSAKWSLHTAIHYAEATDHDAGLVDQWKEVLEKIYVPQNDIHYLEYLGDEEDREYQSYQGIRAPVYLGFPTGELKEDLDEKKAVRTLKHAWQRNHHGEGMLGFIANWYALAAQNYGLGDLALEMAARNFQCYDQSGTALCEGPDNLDRYYFLTTTASYCLFPLNMLVANYNDTIIKLPAVPESWRDLEFYNLSTTHGRKLNGKIKNGKTESIVAYSNSD